MFTTAVDAVGCIGTGFLLLVSSAAVEAAVRSVACGGDMSVSAALLALRWPWPCRPDTELQLVKGNVLGGDWAVEAKCHRVSGAGGSQYSDTRPYRPEQLLISDLTINAVQVSSALPTSSWQAGSDWDPSELGDGEQLLEAGLGCYICSHDVSSRVDPDSRHVEPHRECGGQCQACSALEGTPRCGWLEQDCPHNQWVFREDSTLFISPGTPASIARSDHSEPFNC